MNNLKTVPTYDSSTYTNQSIDHMHQAHSDRILAVNQIFPWLCEPTRVHRVPVLIVVPLIPISLYFIISTVNQSAERAKFVRKNKARQNNVNENENNNIELGDIPPSIIDNPIILHRE